MGVKNGNWKEANGKIKRWGTTEYQNDIFKANTDQLNDPNKIQPGQRLKTPKP